MVNQLLTEMDGFRKEELVFVVATTNFVKSVDTALLRPGRFEFHIEIPYPSEQDRKEIIEIYRNRFDLPLTDDILDYIVHKTEDFVDSAANIRYSGDHLYALCRALKREVFRQKMSSSESSVVFTHSDVDRALALNKPKRPQMTQDERRVVAYHEAGHALASQLLEHSPNVRRVVLDDPYTGAAGYTSSQTKENLYVVTQAEYLAQISTLLAGREAERLIFSQTSGGAWDDLRRATSIAHFMVSELGMSKIGPMVLTDIERASGSFVTLIENEVRRILTEQQQNISSLLHVNRAALDEIAANLLSKNALEGDDLETIIAKHTI